MTRSMKLLPIGMLCLLLASFAHAEDEDILNDRFCEEVGGEREVRHPYIYPGGVGYVFVDCETEEAVYEGGKDSRSSLDSVQQALFFASLTGKQPAVVIYDTDGKVGRIEHRIRVACVMAGVQFHLRPY